MAKKKQETKDVPATAVETKPVRLDLTPDRHKLLRKIAAEFDQPMATHIRDVVNAYIDGKAKELGVKP